MPFCASTPAAGTWSANVSSKVKDTVTGLVVVGGGGGGLPAVTFTVVDADEVWPPVSVTVSRTVKVPAVVYACSTVEDGWASVRDPSPKSNW